MLTGEGMICTLHCMSHSELIKKWPSLASFAEDVGVGYEAAKAMRRRNSVPGAYWMRMVSAATRREISGVTLEALAVAVGAPVLEAEAAE